MSRVNCNRSLLLLGTSGTGYCWVLLSILRFSESVSAIYQSLELPGESAMQAVRQMARQWAAPLRSATGGLLVRLQETLAQAV